LFTSFKEVDSPEIASGFASLTTTVILAVLPLKIIPHKVKVTNGADQQQRRGHVRNDNPA
jgi:hypothetical protein